MGLSCGSWLEIHPASYIFPFLGLCLAAFTASIGGQGPPAGCLSLAEPAGFSASMVITLDI